MDFKDYIIRNTAGNLYWKDINGVYLGCNDVMAKVFRLKDPSEVIGKTDYDFFLADELVDCIIKNDQEVIKTGEAKTFQEIGADVDGKLVMYLTNKIPLRDEQGKIIGLMGTSLDITKQYESDLAKKAFMANISHDLRTPFSGIKGFAEMLYKLETDEKKKEYLGYIKDSADVLLKIINDIIEAASKGTSSVIKAPFNLLDALQENVKLLNIEAAHKQLKLIVYCPNEFIISDRERISKIIMHLISNAIRFTERGSITITAKTSPNLTITVKDTGIGIPEDKLVTIFDMFTKLIPSYKNGKYNGLGTGLAVANQFAVQLGGKIDVKSKVGQGSTFSLYLPL